MNRHQRQHQSGYNLIEVIFATAILGVVAISVFTLFFMGRRNVYSGKQMSQAIAIGTQVLEDLSPLSKKMIYNGAFGIADTATGAALTLPRVSTSAAPSFAAAKIRSTNATIVASAPADISTQSTPPALLTRWSNLLGTKLSDGSVTVVLEPLNDPTNTPPQFATAQLLHVRVFVRWKETSRDRELILDSVKAF